MTRGSAVVTTDTPKDGGTLDQAPARFKGVPRIRSDMLHVTGAVVRAKQIGRICRMGHTPLSAWHRVTRSDLERVKRKVLGAARFPYPVSAISSGTVRPKVSAFDACDRTNQNPCCGSLHDPD